MHQAGGVVPGAARASLREAKMSAHPWPVRLTHWMNAAAMTVMIMSGWRIYDASPLFPFVIPAWLTLGDWLGGALACHFAAMWLLATNFTAYLLFGLRSGHIRRRLLPLSARAIVRDLTLRCGSACRTRVATTTPCKSCFMYWRAAALPAPSCLAWRSGSRFS